MPVPSIFYGRHGAKRSVKYGAAKYCPICPCSSPCQCTSRGKSIISKTSHDTKLLILLQLNTNADKMGIMGNHTMIISNIWLCGFNQVAKQIYGTPKPWHILPLNVLTTVNVILLTIFHRLYPEYEYIYIYIYALLGLNELKCQATLPSIMTWHWSGCKPLSETKMT